MAGTDEYERAKARVMRSPKLRPLADYILADFRESDHYEWVATASVADIHDWAKTIKRECDLEKWHETHASGGE